MHIKTIIAAFALLLHRKSTSEYCFVEDTQSACVHGIVTSHIPIMVGYLNF